MSTPVEIAVRAVGTAAAGRAIGGLDSKTSKLGSTLRNVAKAGAVALGAGAVYGAKKLIDFTQAAIEDEAAQSRLAQTLKNTTGATDKQVASVEKWITRQGKLLGITDDELRPALQRMAEGTKSVGKAQRMVSLAMDVSAGTGKSLKTVTEALLRAQNGSVGGLSRYGIATKNAKGETLSFDQVVKGMAETFGGQAAKQAGTLEGKMARLKVVLSEAGESIGSKLIPLLSDLVPSLQDAAEMVTSKVVPAVGDMVDWFRRNKDEIGTTAASIRDGLLPPLKTLGGVVADVARFLGGLPGPVQSFGAQAAAAALILPRLSGALNTTRASASGLVTNLRNAETRTDALRSAVRLAAGAGGIALMADAANDADGPIKELKDTAGKTALAFAVGGPFAAAVTGFVDIIGSAQGAGEDFGLSQEELAGQIDRVTASLNRQTGAFTKRTKNQLIADLGDKGLLKTANDMNIALPQLVRATMQGTQGIQAFREKYLSSLPDSQRAKFIDLTETLFDMSGALITGQRGFILEREAAGKSGKVIQAVREKVRDLANQFFILPRQVNTIVKAVGADNSRKNVQKLARQYGLTPHEIRTIFKTGNIEAVRRDLKHVQDGAKDTRRELEDVGHARANVNQWVRDVFGGTQDARHKAQEGARGVADALKSPVEKARVNLGPFGADIGAGMNRLTGQARIDGAGVGNALKSGVVSGFAGTASQLATDAYNAVATAIRAARRAADARSPSKKMRKLGRDMADGLILGFDDGSEGIAKVSERLANLIATTYARRAKAARKRIDNAKAEAAQLRQLDNQEKARVKQLRNLDDALVKNGRAQDENNRKLDAARAKLKTLVTTAQDYATSIRDAVVATGDVTTLGKDEAGTATVGGILDQMRDRVAAAQRFADLIRTLTKSGLNKTTLRQLLAAGVEGGLTTAEALAAGGKDAIGQVNKLTGQLTDAGTGLGDKASKTMFGAGVKTAEGLVRGLESKEKHLDQVAKRLANTLANAVRKALKIQSPSKVFRDLGAQTVAGLTIGLDDTHVRRSGQLLATSLVDGFADPKLTARAVFAQTVGAGGTTQPVVIELSAEQVSQVEQGRRIQIKLDAFNGEGGRRRKRG